MLGENFLCDFSTKADSPQAGNVGDPFISTSLGTADSGHIWLGSGAFQPGIKSGFAVNSDPGSNGGYGYIDLGGPVVTQSAIIKYGAGGSGIVLASCNRPPANQGYNALAHTTHIQFTRTGYNFQVRLRERSAGGSNGFDSIDYYTYAVPLNADATLYTVSVTFNKSGAIVTLGDGTIRKVYNTGIGQVIGRFLMFQAMGTVANGGGIKLCSATIGGRNMV